MLSALLNGLIEFTQLIYKVVFIISLIWIRRLRFSDIKLLGQGVIVGLGLRHCLILRLILFKILYNKGNFKCIHYVV